MHKSYHKNSQQANNSESVLIHYNLAMLYINAFICVKQ